MALSLSFLKLHVADVAKAEVFYSAAFGLEVVARIEGTGGREAMLEVIMAIPNAPSTNARLILVSYADRPCPKPGEATTGFVVEDLAAALERAVEAGARVEIPTTEVPEHGLRLAFILDPQGHRVELLQRVAT